MRLNILLLCFLFSVQLFGQGEPCKSYPMKGYSGLCNDLSVLFTADGKYVYSSDRLTLKKWDMRTKKVIEEIGPFPYRLLSITDDPRFIRIKEDPAATFDLVSKVIVPPVTVDEQTQWLRQEKKLTNRLNASGLKGFERLKKLDAQPRIWFGSDSTVAIIQAAGKFYTADLSTNKIEQLWAGNRSYFVPEINTLLTPDPKTRMLLLIDVKTGAKLNSGQTTEIGERVVLGPGKKHLIMTKNVSTVLLDLSTGQVALRLMWGQLKFSPDATRLFYYTTEDYGPGTKQIKSVQEYSYPDLKEISYKSPEWRFKIRATQFHLDTEKRIFYLHHTTDRNVTPMGVYAYDFEKDVITDSVSFVYKPSADELLAEKKVRAERERLGNLVLAKLADMKTPPYVHPLNEVLVTGYTDDGLVAITNPYWEGQITILWSFPEGKPLAAYCDEKTEDTAPANSIVVEGMVRKTVLSPTCKTIGFESNAERTKDNRNILIYQNGVLKVKAENRVFAALLDDYALVWTVAWNGVKESLNLINISTGASQPVKSEIFDVAGDARYRNGKVFFPFYDKVGVFDLANPAGVTFYPNADVKKSGYMTHTAEGFGSAFMLNRVTGQKELIPDYKPTGEYIGSDKLVLRSDIMISGYWEDGFHVFDVDAQKTVSNGYLFSGWKKFRDLVYFKNLGKLLVLHSSPIYTWPNAKPEDPGASAYTIDVKTGEMIPYILTEDRATYMVKEKEWSQSTYTYTPPSKTEKCAQMARLYSKGDNLYSSKGQPLIIMLGYDCERETYVALKREKLFKDSNSTTQVSRPFEITIEQLHAGDYRATSGTWHVCPECDGYPAGFHTENYSGWSDWEQKSLNIYVYTRKWESGTNLMRTECKRCKGEAWVK